jgi:hypothetical protein
MIAEGRRNFVIDFDRCTSMDSTFLGIIAGAGIELRNQNPPGRLVLCRLGTRNLELVRNVGLDRFLPVKAGIPEMLSMESGSPSPRALNAEGHDRRRNAEMILKAHENLLEIDDANRHRFQDVIAFLKNQVDTA